jgi:pilus assembly protein CpaB
MRPKTIILMAVAVTCGLAASYLTTRIIAENNSPPTVEKVGILVARRNLAMGTLLSEPEKFFEEKLFILGEEPKRAIRSFEELRGQRLNRRVAEEQFVTAEDLIDREKTLAVTPGKVAMTLNVNAKDGVGGFVQPHSHVDIVAVLGSGTGDSCAKIILQKTLVLAVDQNVGPLDGKAMVANTVTVEVTPEQAQRLALAQKMRSLSLVLRSFEDDTKISLNPTTAKDILQGSGDKPDGGEFASDDFKAPARPSPYTAPDGPELKPVAPAQPGLYNMDIYNGDKLTKASFPVGDK